MLSLPCSARLVPVLLGVFLALPAVAQDSFARIAAAGTGQTAFSVLGTGLGLPYASLALEMRCPSRTAWVIDVTGVHADPGTSATFGFGDPRGGYTAIRVALLRYDEERVQFSIDRADFRAALAQARADYPEPAGTDARVVIGETVGLAVGRDALVREMTAFAAECEGSSPMVTARRR